MISCNYNFYLNFYCLTISTFYLIIIFMTYYVWVSHNFNLCYNMIYQNIIFVFFCGMNGLPKNVLLIFD